MLALLPLTDTPAGIPGEGYWRNRGPSLDLGYTVGAGSWLHHPDLTTLPPCSHNDPPPLPGVLPGLPDPSCLPWSSSKPSWPFPSFHSAPPGPAPGKRLIRHVGGTDNSGPQQGLSSSAIPSCWGARTGGWGGATSRWSPTHPGNTTLTSSLPAPRPRACVTLRDVIAP